MYIEAGEAFEASYAHGATGILATLEVAVFDNDGNIVIGPTQVGITEEIVGVTPTGVYTWNAPAAPPVPGQYSIVWTPTGDWDATFNSTVDELVVVESVAGEVLPPLPALDGGGIAPGPCTAWTTDASIEECSGILPSLTLTNAIRAASEILYELSARRFPGLCERTVRPCQTSSASCGIQILSRGYVVWPPDWGYGWNGINWGMDCGCSPLSSVELVGKPVREIIEVLIDGAIVPATEYRLDQQQYLVRLNNGFWPACQNLSLEDSEVGTWSVTYEYGQAVPMIGQMAARDLAIEIYRSCIGGEAECELPEGVTRVTRQGITYELPALIAWGRDFSGIWRTGMPWVDAFLSAMNPKGLMRRPILYVPGASKQARKVGI